MSLAIPSITRLVLMPGPNLLSDLPGVRLSARWPPAALDGGAPAARVMAALLDNPDLASVRAQGQPAGDPADLDEVVAAIAGLAMPLVGQPMAGGCGAWVAREESAVIVAVHRDLALAVQAARLAFTLTVAVVSELLRSGAATAAMEQVGRDLGEFRGRWQAIGFGDLNWRKIAAAEARGIPWRRLAGNDRILLLGHGCRQVRAMDTMIDQDGYIAVRLATHKYLANTVLHAAGLPVPRSAMVTDRRMAVAQAGRIGYPVVVKPSLTDFGIAVAVNLQSDDAVARAFDAASRHGPVMVEQHVPGAHYRLLVMHGKFLSANRQDPAQVIGDGTSSVDRLTALANSGRRDTLSGDLKKIVIDAEAIDVLRRQGLTMESVPAAGRRVLLREHSNLSVGGSYRNVTSQVHPDNRRLAETAAAIVGLRIAGVDFIASDISRSYLETGGMICEINPRPGTVMGEPDGLVENAFLDGLFPDQGNGRIPIVALVSPRPQSRPQPRLLQRLEAIAADLGHRAVVATRSAVRFHGEVVTAGDFDPVFPVEAALRHPGATAAIVQLASDDIAEAGLVFDRCALAVAMEQAEASSDAARRDKVLSLLARHSERMLHASDEAAIAAAVRQVLAAGGAASR